jgi:hypothetical protein
VPSESQSIQQSTISRIYGRGRGCVFTPNEFLDLGSRQAIDLALHRLTAAGTISRVARGLYSYPQLHALLGKITPSIEVVAKALAARDQVKLQPSGAYAANLLGLSEQVPAKIVYLTSGPARKLRLGKLGIELRPATPRQLATAGRVSGSVIAALRYLGKANVTPDRIARLRQVLSKQDRKSLPEDLAYAPVWTHPLLKAIAAD